VLRPTAAGRDHDDETGAERSSYDPQEHATSSLSWISIVARPSLKLVVLAGVVLLAAGAVVAAVALRSKPASQSASTEAAAPASNTGFPVPPKGGVLYARQLGAEALALGVVPKGGSVLAQASVLSGQGQGVSGLSVSLNGRPAAGCGSGCYATTLTGPPKSITVHVRSTSWNVALPSPWPPRDGTAIVDRATAAWRALDSLTFDEHLASDATHSTTSTWRVQAPNRVAYTITGGGADGIIVGDRRWDRTTPSSKWIESPQTELTQPVPPWTAVRDAHVLGEETFEGHRSWLVSFFDPGTPAWFTVVIEQKTYRTLQTEMITTAHFMHDVYGAFNKTPPITAPR
jgi:hypothetical protein